MSAPALVNVGSLLLLLMVVYALVAVQLFYGVRGTVPQIVAGEVTDLEFVNEWANFESFGTALFTMFRCVTGESWNGIMHDCYRVSVWASILFFTSYFIAGRVFMLNLFIAVILENFNDVAEEYEAPVTPLHLQQFVEAWAEFDLRSEGQRTKASYTMQTVNLLALLMAVPPPLGLSGTEVNRADVLKRVRELHIPDHLGVVHMHEVLYACTERVYGVLLSEKDREAHIGARADKAPALLELKAERPAAQEVANFYAASYVQAAWRGFVARGPDGASPPPSPDRASRATAAQHNALMARRIGDGRVAPTAATFRESSGGHQPQAKPEELPFRQLLDQQQRLERARQLPPLQNPPRPAACESGALRTNPPRPGACRSGLAHGHQASRQLFTTPPPHR